MDATLLCLTTLPHLTAIALSPSPLYSVTVATSTGFSVAWHWSGHSRWLGVADYTVATVWLLLDAYYAHLTGTLATVLLWNAVIVGLNQATDWVARRGIAPYPYAHSAWHIASVIKVIVVAAELQGLVLPL